MLLRQGEPGTSQYVGEKSIFYDVFNIASLAGLHLTKMSNGKIVPSFATFSPGPLTTRSYHEMQETVPKTWAISCTIVLPTPLCSPVGFLKALHFYNVKHPDKCQFSKRTSKKNIFVSLQVGIIWTPWTFCVK